MKILKIEFKNINSLEGEHCIDFTQKPFEDNSLFAITGPTGSGKSTILDVISLALYNKIPRLDSISKSNIEKTGSILTKGKRSHGSGDLRLHPRHYKIRVEHSCE